MIVISINGCIVWWGGGVNSAKEHVRFYTSFDKFKAGRLCNTIKEIIQFIDLNLYEKEIKLTQGNNSKNIAVV